MAGLPLAPPRTAQHPHVHNYHGRRFPDPFHWLRTGAQDEIRHYLKLENAYTEARLQHTEALREKLYMEIKGRVQEEDQSVPYRDGPFFYYTRTEEGKNYAIYCRRHALIGASEEILLDANVLAAGLSYFSLGNYSVSPDHARLAYAVDTVGDENYTLYVRDLPTGKIHPKASREQPKDWNGEATIKRSFIQSRMPRIALFKCGEVNGPLW